MCSQHHSSTSHDFGRDGERRRSSGGGGAGGRRGGVNGGGHGEGGSGFAAAIRHGNIIPARQVRGTHCKQATQGVCAQRVRQYL